MDGTTIIPAANTTLPNVLTLKYVYVIVGIYAVILTIILIIIIVIVIKKISDSLCPSYNKVSFSYGTIQEEIQESCPHHQTGELNPVVDIFERSVESEYDNVSLDQEASRVTDVPPEYEHPPAYRISEPV